MDTKNRSICGKSNQQIYTIQHDQQMGHDNLGHSIPELLETAAPTLTISDTSVTYNPIDSSITVLKDDFKEHQTKMSPIPAHDRMLIGRRLALGIDTFLFIFFVIWLLLIELGIFPHVKRGFFCDDRSITMKYNGETISSGAIVSSIFLMYPILWLCEACYFVPVSLKSSRCVESARRAWKWFKEYMFGIVLHLFVVDGLKVLFGELRPHFLDTCRPDVYPTCTGGEYIVNYQCTNNWDSSFFIRDASKSFPSGHSSISFFEAVFFIWYLQMRSPRMRSRLLIPTVQCFFLLFACLCGLSRITDHRHHWWDVLAGAKIGALFAALTCIFLCKNFQKKRVNNIEPIIQNGNGTLDNRHTSVRRLLSERTKDELNLSHVVVP